MFAVAHAAGRRVFGPLCIIACVALATPLVADDARAAESRRPNVVFFLADDLGYGDLGCFGQQKIRTPNLDRLAAGGMRLTQHYCGNAVCALSRCVLMTGLHPGHAFIRDNRSVQPEGQYPLPADTVTLAKLLKAQGYATGGFGKWGLGPPGGYSTPARQGFDRFYGYLCQAVAHNYYPTYLWSDDQRVELDNPAFSAQQHLPAETDPRDPASYQQYTGHDYAPDLIGGQALEFVRQHKDEPFFLYFPTTVPHLALQVPDDSLAEYRGQLPDEPYVGDRRYLPQREPHAAYAAMITRMDRDMGRVINLVKDLGLADDTIFIFSSDNGPLYDELGGTDTDFFNSAGGLRGRKGSLYEGGIRAPTIVRWQGHIQPGTTTDRVSGFEDWLPTILELIGASDATPSALDGISLAPTLLGRSQPPRPFLYREFPSYGGQQSVRTGDWKGIRQNLKPRGKAAPDLTIELYNLADDVTETHNVAGEHPDVVRQIETLMRRPAHPLGSLPAEGLGHAVTPDARRWEPDLDDARCDRERIRRVSHAPRAGARRASADFSRTVVAPQARHWEHQRQYPAETLRAACAAGLATIELPPERGGAGLRFSAKLRIVEEMARHDFGFAFSLVNHHNALVRIARSDARLADRLLPAMLRGELIGCAGYTEPGHGSDLGHLTTTAVPAGGGWMLDGAKTWITNGAVAGVVITLAQTDPAAGPRGIATFAVEAARQGFVRAPAIDVLGGSSIGTGGFELRDYFAPAEALLDPPGEAFRHSLAGINGARAYVAAMCAGMLGAALAQAVEYASGRRAFGKPIIEFQGLRWSLVDAATDLAALRLLTYRAARLIDAGGDAEEAAAAAKKFAGEKTLGHLAACVQALGANGLSDQYPLMRHLAAAKIACFTDGTTEIMNERLGKLLVGRASAR